MIRTYGDFVAALLEAGFSMGSGNAENIFALCPFDFHGGEMGGGIRWHTGDPETDPWEWRMRVLDERDDVAYAKVFFKKSGYITRDWYPYFLAVRREGRDADGEYRDGRMSFSAKRVYDAVREGGPMPAHTLRRAAGFGKKEDGPRFERALVELQMKLFLTMRGRLQKRSHTGQAYGWASAVFCVTERFFGGGVFERAAHISRGEAIEQITGQILRLNPAANPKNIGRFITG